MRSVDGPKPLAPLVPPSRSCPPQSSLPLLTQQGKAKGWPLPPDAGHFGGKFSLQSFLLGWPILCQACIVTFPFLSKGLIPHKHILSQILYKHLLPENLIPNHPSREIQCMNHILKFSVSFTSWGTFWTWGETAPTRAS